MSEQRQAYIPKSSLDSFSNALYAERLELGSREPILNVGVNVNQKNTQWSTVEVKVLHFIRGEEKIKSFDAPTTPKVVRAALAKLKQYATIPYSSDEKRTMSWDVMGPKIVNGKMSNERTVKAKLVVGRTKKGPFISVVHWNTSYPHIAFYPGLNDGNNVRPTSTDDAEQVYEYVCSSAIGWAEHIGDLLSAEWVSQINRVLEAQRTAQGSNGGGSYGGNNNNSGGGYGNNGSYTTTGGTESSGGGGFNF